MGALSILRTPAAPDPARSPLWGGVDRLIDRTRDLDRLRLHGVQLLAANRWRERGLEVPASLLQEERVATVAALTAATVLRRARNAYDGPIIVQKGPEAAAAYPDPALRPFADLDIIVPDAAAAQRALCADGFQEVGDPSRYLGIHHLRPLLLGDLPLRVEIHSAPKWPERLSPPPFGALLEAAMPSSTGVEGVLALARSQHALVLAAHSWAHRPLRRLGELVDVAAVSDGLDRGELASLARSWGFTRVWGTTIDAADSLLLLEARDTTWPLRIWARHLAEIRDRTVLESHLERWLSSFSAVPPHIALLIWAETLADELRPAADETWGQKLSRTGRAVRNAFTSRQEHAAGLGPDAQRWRRSPR